MPVPIPQVKLVQCKYNNDSNLIGALQTIRKYTKRGSNEPLVFIGSLIFVGVRPSL